MSDFLDQFQHDDRMLTDNTTFSDEQRAVSKLHDDAFASLESIAGDGRYSGDHKRELFKEARDHAVAKIESKRDAMTAKYESIIAELEAETSIETTPTTDEIAVLTYMRDTIQAKWNAGSVRTITDEWRELIQSDERVKLRVYYDFAAAAIQSKEKSFPSQIIEELMHSTRHALMTKKQKLAAQRLAHLREKSETFHRESHRLLAQLRHAQINGDQVTDGIRAEYAARLKGSW